MAHRQQRLHMGKPRGMRRRAPVRPVKRGGPEGLFGERIGNRRRIAPIGELRGEFAAAA